MPDVLVTSALSPPIFSIAQNTTFSGTDPNNLDATVYVKYSNVSPTLYPIVRLSNAGTNLDSGYKTLTDASGQFSAVIHGLINNTTYDISIVGIEPGKTTETVLGRLGSTASHTPDANGCTAGDGEYCLLQPLPQGAGNTPFGKLEYNKDTGSLDSLATVFNAYMKVIIGIIGVLAVLMVVLGGIQYMSTDAISGKESGKERITHALFGLFIALGAWILLHEINPDLVSLNLKSLSSVNTAVQMPKTDLTIDIPTTTATGWTLDAICEDTTLPLKNPPNKNQIDCSTIDKCSEYAKTIAKVVGSNNGSRYDFLYINMVEESHCKIDSVSKANACGIFQQLPSTAEMFKVSCGVPKGTIIDCAWLKNEKNLEADVCIQNAFIESLKPVCGDKLRNLAAGQNGGSTACETSVDCAGLKSCVNGNNKVMRWECPWDNLQHTVYNTGYNESRNAQIKMDYCYNQIFDLSMDGISL